MRPVSFVRGIPGSALAILALVACSDSATEPEEQVESGVAAELEVVAGHGQAALAPGALDSFVVRVVDAQGNPVPNATVRWRVRNGSGTVAQTSTTDANGRARNKLSLATHGVATVLASVEGVEDSARFRGRVVTHPAGNLLDKAEIGGQPFGVAISDEGLVAASQVAVDSVVFVDSLANVLGATEVGNQPVFISFTPGGRKLFVANRSPSNSAMGIDVDTRTVTHTLPMGWSPFGLAVDEPGNRLYVADDDSLHVYQIPANNRLAAIPLGDNSEGLAFNEHGTRIYLGTRSLGKVIELNTSTFTVAREFTGLGGRVQGVAVHGDTLFAVIEEGALKVIDLETGDVETMELPLRAYGATITPDGSQLWISHLFDGQISILDVATRSIVKTLDVGGRPRVIAFSATGSFAAIANESGWVDIVR